MATGLFSPLELCFVMSKPIPVCYCCLPGGGAAAPVVAKFRSMNRTIDQVIAQKWYRP